MNIFNSPSTKLLTTIYTFYIGLPEFLFVQAKSLRKFIPDAQQVVVINCREKEDETALVEACEKIALPYMVQPGYYKVGEMGGGKAKRATNAHLQIISDVWQDRIKTDPHGVIVLMDCDLMPIKPFSFVEALGESTIMYRPFPMWALGHPNEKSWRLNPSVEPDPSCWRNFFAVNLDKMVDKELVEFNAAPTGGDLIGKGASLRKWLLAHPARLENHKVFDYSVIDIKGVGQREIYFDTFVHLGRSIGYGKQSLCPSPENKKAFLDYVESKVHLGTD